MKILVCIVIGIVAYGVGAGLTLIVWCGLAGIVAYRDTGDVEDAIDAIQDGLEDEDILLPTALWPGTLPIMLAMGIAYLPYLLVSYIAKKLRKLIPDFDD